MREYLRKAVNRQQYQTWFGAMRPADDSDGFAFSVANQFVRDWIGSYYMQLLADAVLHATGEARQVRVIVRDGDETPAPRREPPPRKTPPRQVAAPARPERQERRPSAQPRRHRRPPSPSFASGATEMFADRRHPNFLSDVLLNDSYRFDRFVRGSGNQLAYAASLAVADSPGQAYNPLFLHGGVGLGKTHLLQAICATVLERNPETRIIYLSCETFVNQFISAVAAGDLENFRYRYRHVDMLLIDDIHFLAKKERTQEEFFHTFNTLYNQQKQIILSCDSPPREIPTLEERLVSRFKWGLVTEIETPDHETRVSIVRQKAEERGYTLPDDVTHMVADNITSNVRELEGAVQRVIGYASLSGKSISMELATDALRGIVQPKERKITIEAILRAVAEHFGVKASELMGRRRHKSISVPRQVVMYLARQLTDYALVEIGGQIGGRDHTTVIYAVERIAQQIETNGRLRDDVETIVRRLRSLD